MPNVQWNEPAAFKRNYPKPAPWIDKTNHICFGVVAFVLLLLRAITGGEDPVGWITMLLVALLAGAVFGYLLPVIIKLAPNTVVVSEKGINCHGFGLIANIWPAVQATFYNWDTFAAATTETVTAGSGTFRALCLKDPVGKNVAVIALAQQQDETTLRAKLNEHRKQLQIK